MSVRSLLPICLFALAACGGDSGGTPDAPRADAKPSTVMAVTCPATPAATFTTQASSFSPTSATITAGQIIRIESTTDHPVGPFPDASMTDSSIVVSENQTKCFMFTQPGTFKFICTRHQYAGTVTVN